MNTTTASSAREISLAQQISEVYVPTRPQASG